MASSCSSLFRLSASSRYNNVTRPHCCSPRVTLPHPLFFSCQPLLFLLILDPLFNSAPGTCGRKHVEGCCQTSPRIECAPLCCLLLLFFRHFLGLKFVFDQHLQLAVLWISVSNKSCVQSTRSGTCRFIIASKCILSCAAAPVRGRDTSRELEAWPIM